MLSVADAARTVIERMPRLAAELVSLDGSIGRILASVIVAERPLPGFDNSAMDGYAVRASDVPGALPIAGEVAAGSVRTSPVPVGSCVRIFTGAPIPSDLDTVVMQEDVSVANGIVTLPPAQRGDHVRRAGEDVAIGDTILTAGTRIVPWHIGLLAALGVAQLPVSRRPRVAIIATGDELVTVDTAPGPGQLVASSSHALAALIRECGGDPHVLGIARDDIGEIKEMIARALGVRMADTGNLGPSPVSFDAVITTGGVSVGDHDHVHTALAAAGVTRELYKVAMKPGKPFAFGLHHTKPVFGLPGNPVSTITAFELFVRPALLAMQGATIVDRPRVPVHLAEGYRKQTGRTHFLRAQVTREATREGEVTREAKLVARAHGKQGSAMQSSLVETNALVEIPADASEVPAGAVVTAILFEPV